MDKERNILKTDTNKEVTALLEQATLFGMPVQKVETG